MPAERVCSIMFSRDIEGLHGKAGTGTTDAIHLLAWSWGAAFGNGDEERGRRHAAGVQDLSLTKFVDAYSTWLASACCTQTRIAKAVFVVDTNSKAPHGRYTFTMEDVLVSSVAMGGSGGESHLTENISLSFNRILVEYREQAAGAKKKAVSTSYSWARHTSG